MTTDNMNQVLLKAVHRLCLSAVDEPPVETFTQATCLSCKKTYLIEFGCKHD